MKKLYSVIFLSLICLAFVGCSSNKSATSTPKTKDLPYGNYQDMGEGTVIISTPGGTSEDGTVPVIFIEKDQTMAIMEIGISTRDLDGSHLSYVYIDGMFNSKEQYSDADGSIVLSPDDLTIASHTVELVQYNDDTPEGEMITYKSASYEIKSK